MDHQQALKLRAAERYILHELTPDERDDFEEHYFTCPECADEIRSVFTLADNTKSVFRDEARAVKPPASSWASPQWLQWLQWLRPALAVPVAAALLLGITLYQSMFVIPRLERDLAGANQAQVIPTVVARAATRGEDPAVEISPGDRFVQLTLDVNVTGTDSAYTCEIYDEAGGLRFSVPSAVPSKGSLHLLLPASGLKPGRYTIRVRPRSASEIPADEYSFVLRTN